MKILLFSDGKYGDRAIEVVKKKFPSTELILLEERDPTIFLDEVDLGEDIEKTIEEADLLILYLQHPDIVAEICDFQKPTILPINFGEGFLKQVRDSNPKVIQPKSMCHALPDTGINEIDNYFEKYGTPIYNIKLEPSNNDAPIIKEITLSVESPCGASNATLEHLRGKPLTQETLNNFAINVRQECREPLTPIFSRRDMAESSGITHLLSLLKAIKKEDPSLSEPGTPIGNFLARISNQKFN